jgi:hypothetical protein
MAENHSQFSQKSLDAALTLLGDLKTKAKQAEAEEDVFTFGILNDLIRTVSPIVNRAHARLLREENARINKAHKDLRAKVRPHLERE